jgi:predicted nuclease of predicted toxin-antitoxin system
VKFLIDAQLPARLARWFTAQGYDCIHTTELPNGNRTTDQQITEVADVDDRVVVTKDRDFRDGHLLHRAPRRLWLISTGNITNDDLLGLIATHLDVVVGALDEVAFIELEPTQLVLHR